MNEAPAAVPKPKKSVALSGVVAGNTQLCTVGRTGNDLHYRGYDILDIADVCEFEEIAYLLEGRDGPVLVYMMDAQDWDQARRAYQASTLAIDLQHREIMEEVSDGPAATEMLYECRMAAD